MNYSALIQNRKSVREFADKKVSAAALAEIETYYQKSCQRLVPELETKLCIFGQEAREALEGAAGYESFLIGAPNYLVLLSAKSELAGENAGYMMEDLVLKLTDMDLGCCWITFTDSEKVKAALQIDSALDVAAIVAFGGNLLLWLMDVLNAAIDIKIVNSILTFISPYQRCAPFKLGQLSFANALYFVAAIFLCLFFSVRTLDARRWREA